MNYFEAFFRRAWRAIRSLPFWVELLFVLPLSCLGVWFPWIFDWRGSETFFHPGPWFTFGVATLMIIIANRLFMPERDDKYLMANKLVLLIPTFIAVLLYGKSLHEFVNFDPSQGAVFDYSYTKIAICLTMFVWGVNFFHVDKFDDKRFDGPLGGEV